MKNNNKIFVVLFLLFLGLCSGCGNPKKIKLVTSNSVILAFGDSLTAGTGANKNESYPAVLEKILNCKVINEGIPGETSGEGLLRLPAILKKYNPNLVILCLGGNDFLRKKGELNLSLNLEKMIQTIQENGADAILIGVPKPGIFLKTHELYNELSDKYNVPLQSKIIKKILTSPELKSDYVHPNRDGYRKLAIELSLVIKENSKNN